MYSQLSTRYADNIMKYLVKANILPRRKGALLAAIADDTLGEGSVAFGEYVKNMKQARVLDDGCLCWVEVCFCSEPLHEERTYWENYFELLEISPAVNPKECQDSNGEEKQACLQCVCAQELEGKMKTWGEPFL